MLARFERNGAAVPNRFGARRSRAGWYALFVASVVAKPLRVPLLVAAVAGCLLVGVEQAGQSLPPPSPPPTLAWPPPPWPLVFPPGSISGSGTVDIVLCGDRYFTGIDLTVSNAQVFVDGVETTDPAVVKRHVLPVVRRLLLSHGVSNANVDDLTALAVAAPGTRVSVTFADRQRSEVLAKARDGALGTLWVALGVSAVWVSARAMAWFGEWRGERAERCGGCGYSLTGLGDGAPCPECGRPSGVSGDPYLERLRKKEWR